MSCIIIHFSDNIEQQQFEYCTTYSSQQPQVFFNVTTIGEVITGPNLGCQLLLYMSDAFVLMSSMVCV